MDPQKTGADSDFDGALGSGIKGFAAFLKAPWVPGWVLASVVLCMSAGAAAVSQMFSEPDDAMRLVQVRDFIAGQGWFDLTQYRLFPPDGTSMHWARWVDAAIGVPIALMALVVDQRVAEVVMAFVWPLGWLVAFMMLVTQVAMRLAEIGAHDGETSVDPKWVGVASGVIAALAFPTLDKFAPGSFDHHNVELVLVMAGVLALIDMRRVAWMGGVAGGCLALAMATAAEGLPFLAIGALVAGCLWLVWPDTYARALVWFAGGLAGVSVLSFLTLVPPPEWGAQRCDAMSSSFLAIGLLGAGVAGVLGGVVPNALRTTLMMRVASAGALGVVAVVALWVLAPGCVGGGYSALSDEMMRYWMAQISEARSLATVAQDNIGMTLSMSGAALVGLVLAGFYLRGRYSRPEGWIVAAFLVAGIGFLVWQVRGAAFATAFAIPFAGWGVIAARNWYRTSSGMSALLAFAAVAVLSTSAAWATIGSRVQAWTTPRAVMNDFGARQTLSKNCFAPDSMAALGEVEPGLVLNNFGIAASVLLMSEHSVVAAAYHRNQTGTLQAIRAFRSSEEAAREIIADVGADYILTCPGLPEARFYAANPMASDVKSEETLAALLSARTPPAWLEVVELSDPTLALYRVRLP